MRCVVERGRPAAPDQRGQGQLAVGRRRRRRGWPRPGSARRGASADPASRSVGLIVGHAGWSRQAQHRSKPASAGRRPSSTPEPHWSGAGPPGSAGPPPRNWRGTGLPRGDQRPREDLLRAAAKQITERDRRRGRRTWWPTSPTPRHDARSTTWSRGSARGRARAQRRRSAARPDPRRRRPGLAAARSSCCCSARCGWPARRCRGWPARGFGRVVVVTSTAVRQPQPDLAASVVLRSAVTAAAKLLAREYAGRRRDGELRRAGAPPPPSARPRSWPAGRRPAGVSQRTLDGRDRATIPAGRPGKPGGDRRGDRLPGLRGGRATSTAQCSPSTADGRRRSGDRIRHGRLPGRAGGDGTARAPRGRSWCTPTNSNRCPPTRCTTRPSLSIAGQPADHDVRAVPADDPGRAELRTCSATTTRPCTSSSPGPGTQRDRGRDRHLVDRRLRLHAAVDLAPPLQRLHRRPGRVPHHRELPAARGLRAGPPSERRPG